MKVFERRVLIYYLGFPEWHKDMKAVPVFVRRRYRVGERFRIMMLSLNVKK